MGTVFGKVEVETPKHETIHSSPDYEVRKYPSCVIAQVTYDPSNFNSDKDGGFMILANYIGALGNPQNTKPEKIAMTAPVITQSEPANAPEKIAMTAPVITQSASAKKPSSEKIAMTAPVITSKEEQNNEMVTMGFILPDKYKKVEDAPRPVDERVVIREEGERKYGVVRFNGVARDKVVAEKVEKLRACLERDGFKVVGDHVLARYNPPWTLPMFRTNEVFIPVE